MPPRRQRVTNQLNQLAAPHRSIRHSKTFRQLQSQETELENLQHQVDNLESIVGHEASKHRYRDIASFHERTDPNGAAKNDDERHQPEQRHSDHGQVRRMHQDVACLPFLFSPRQNPYVPNFSMGLSMQEQRVRYPGKNDTHTRGLFSTLPDCLFG